MNFKKTMLLGLLFLSSAFADNQTPTVSPILPNSNLPFTIVIEQAEFSLPQGLQSYVYGRHEDKLLLLTGRINGLHGFGPNPDNFPPNQQNTTLFVVDLKTGITHTKSLTDPSSGLTQAQIDILSVTNAQFHQSKDTLYIVGGYGFDTASQTYTTKDSLTAIDVPAAIKWVLNPSPSVLKPLSNSIKQTFDPSLRVTGGILRKGGCGLYLLCLGHDFEGAYGQGGFGIYTRQIRRFYIHDGVSKLSVNFIDPIPLDPDPNYRRRDLNVVPIVKRHLGCLTPAFVALSGVFTETTGMWTVPIVINNDGSSSMAEPNDPSTFKQGMNGYSCANAELFSCKNGDNYILLFGGISFEYIQNGEPVYDSEFPFINQVTTIKIDKKGQFSQYLMDHQFPVILSTASNPGNELLFGSEAEFIPNKKLRKFKNNVLNYDSLIHEKNFIGYIVGGIQSTLPNTSSPSDSAASPYIFKVHLYKKCNL